MHRAILFLQTSAWIVAALASSLQPAHGAEGVDLVSTIQFESQLLGAKKPLVIALPPGYDAAESYPVVYFLHGLNNRADEFLDNGLHEQAAQMIEAGEIDPLILVAPTGDYSYYTNKSDGSAPYEDYVVKEIPAYIEDNYAAQAGGGRAISGISMGGYGAIKIAMRHPGLYSSASGHTAMLIPDMTRAGQSGGRSSRWLSRSAGAVFGNPLDEEMWAANDPFALSKKGGFEGLGLYFNAASQDRYGLDAGARAFDAHLTQLGVEHRFKEIEGDHGWKSLVPEWPEILAFHDQAFKARAKGASPASSPEAAETP